MIAVEPVEPFLLFGFLGHFGQIGAGCIAGIRLGQALVRGTAARRLWRRKVWHRRGRIGGGAPLPPEHACRDQQQRAKRPDDDPIHASAIGGGVTGDEPEIRPIWR